MTTGLIKNALIDNAKPGVTADTAAANIEAAIIATIESATISYVSGLLAPSGGGPVTGTFGNTIS